MHQLSSTYQAAVMTDVRAKKNLFVSTSVAWIEDDPIAQREVFESVLAPLTKSAERCYVWPMREGIPRQIENAGQQQYFQWRGEQEIETLPFLAASRGQRPSLGWCIEAKREEIDAALSHCYDPFVVSNARTAIPPGCRTLAAQSGRLILLLTTNNGLQWLGFVGSEDLLVPVAEVAVTTCRVSDRYADR